MESGKRDGDANFCRYFIEHSSYDAVEIKITAMENIKCGNCWANSIEIKSKDSRSSEPRVCCEKYNNQVYVSKQQPVPIILRFTEAPASYTVQYRSVNPYTPAKIAPFATATVKGQCIDTDPSQCDKYLCREFPISDFYSMKRFCAKLCGFCGRVGPNCMDMQQGCTKEFCSANPDPYFVESTCAKTCGFCENPN